MSKKDGKATLLKAAQKKEVSILSIDNALVEEAKKVAESCPVKIIHVNEF